MIVGWDEGILRRLVAGNVRRFREKRGLTLKQAAALGDLHWRLLQKIEAGEQSATLRTLAKLSNAFGVSPATFFAKLPN